ncbi:MAG TPA: CAP domain-containing protein [Leptolyngbyaceae cyanobacterium]
MANHLIRNQPQTQRRLRQRAGQLVLGAVLCLFGPQLAVAPLSGQLGPTSVHAQQVNHPFNGQSIVYVSRNNQWREAFIQRVSGRSSGGQIRWLYTVQYLDGAREVESSVTVDRMRTLAQAQAQRLTTNVYDLSTQAGIDQMLAAHNRMRREVGVPDLRWSADLAKGAQEWANYLVKENRFEHSPASARGNGTIGENLSSRSSSAPGGSYTTPARAVEGWVNERAYYHYDTNRCDPNQMCGHYTQMVWKSTTLVGCAMARNAQASREVWVCRYNPAGNVVGQRPY